MLLGEYIVKTFFSDLVGVFTFEFVINIFAIFFPLEVLEMDFILNEAEVETDSLKFDSDDEDEMGCDSTPLSEDEHFLTCYEDE